MFINNSTRTQETAKDVARATELKKTQDMFFKLLTTQLKCQDIDNPVDMNQMTQQIFQINELQTLMEVKGLLRDINDSMKSSEAITLASNILGKHVVTKTSNVSVSASDPTLLVGYKIAGEGEANAIMKILNDNDQVVHEVELKNVPSNAMQHLELKCLDGGGALAVPEGVYKIQLLAYNSKDKKQLATEVFATNKIQQVMPNGDFVMSNKEKVNIENIIAVQDSPAFTPLNYKSNDDDQIKQSVSDFMKEQKSV